MACWSLGKGSGNGEWQPLHGWDAGDLPLKAGSVLLRSGQIKKTDTLNTSYPVLFCSFSRHGPSSHWSLRTPPLPLNICGYFPSFTLIPRHKCLLPTLLVQILPDTLELNLIRKFFPPSPASESPSPKLLTAICLVFSLLSGFLS